MDDIQCAWLAGLLEGEGCFYLAARHNKDGTPRPLISVIITMTDEDVIQRVRDVLGYGNIHRRDPKRENRKSSWTWQDSNVDTVVALVQRLRPFMGERRQHKIDEQLEAVRGWKRRTVATHGSRSMYVGGCRCAVCRQANARYMREFNARRRNIALNDDLAKVRSKV